MINTNRYIRSLTINSASGTIYDLNNDFIDDQQSKTALFNCLSSIWQMLYPSFQQYIYIYRIVT